MTETIHRGLRIITGSSDLPGDLKRQATERPKLARGTAPPPATAAQSWTLRIDDWMPTPLNQLINKHWAIAARMKKADAERIAFEAARQGIPAADGKRRVSLVVVLPKGKRATDTDSLHKSTLDGLVHAGLLRNDSTLWAEGAPPMFARGARLVTYITLERI